MWQSESPNVCGLGCHSGAKQLLITEDFVAVINARHTPGEARYCGQSLGISAGNHLGCCAWSCPRSLCTLDHKSLAVERWGGAGGTVPLGRSRGAQPLRCPLP